MNFLTLKTRLARRMNKNATTLDTATGQRLGDFLNEAHQAILRRQGFEKLRYATLTFASVADQKLYALPTHGVARINYITEATNDRRLVYKTGDALDAEVPDPDTGTPCIWTPRGLVEVHTQPSNASAVFVDSTSASDTGTAYVEGIRTGGYYGSASVSMTGTTAVQVGTVTDFIVITKFYLSTAAVGTVTLHEDASAGTELSTIAVGDVRAQFTQFQLFPTPSAVITYTANILRALPEMTNNTDEPLLPEDFHSVLIDGAQLKELTKSDDPQRWRQVNDDYQRGLRELTTFVNNHPDFRPMRSEPIGISTLGSWFPPDHRL